MPKFDDQGPREIVKQTRAKFSQDLQKELQRDDRAAVQKAEKAIAPERIINRRCHTCTHPFRDFIELMLIKGLPFKTIGDRVSPPVDRRSIANHYEEHMDLQDTALRMLLEREADLQGLNFEEGVADIITKKGVLEVALRRGYEDMLNNVTTVEPRDLIQIAKLLAEMESNQQQIGLDELRQQVQIFITAIKDVCDPDTQQAIASRVKQLRSRERIDQPMEDAMAPTTAEAAQIEAAKLLEEENTDWEKYEQVVEVSLVDEEDTEV